MKVFNDEPRGNRIIRRAVQQFHSIIKDLEAGIAQNLGQADANRKDIEALQLENADLRTAADRGQRIAEKLKELIA
jgi:hypothetical protein